MKYILCGTVVCEEYEDKIPQLSNAANRFLKNFINELRKNGTVKVLSYVGIEVPPEIKKRIEKDNITESDVEYCFKSKYKIKGVVAYGQVIKRNLKKAECIIAYNPMYAYLLVPYKAKLYGVRSILILADYTPKEAYRRRLRQIYAALQLRSIRKFDMVIGLSENIKKYLSHRQVFIHMPGGIDRFVYDYFAQREKNIKSDKIIFMYAGILEKVTGIDLLLQAFEEIKADNTELWISGKGSLKDLLEEYIKKDDRIKYLGCLPYEEYLENLKKASILVNPRNMSLLENQNNFPSKIMEYLATGKRIISTRFIGWEKYNDYILFVESRKEDIFKKMYECLNGDRTDNLWEYRRKFSEQFLWENQVKKVFEEMECQKKID